MRCALLIIFTLSWVANLYSQNFHISTIATNSNASFRGISVVDDSVTWISGTNGTIALSVDGGATWDIHSVDGFEKADFRSVYAFNRYRALIVNAGSPTNVLLTNDGGKHWRTVYTNNHADAFVDGIDFWNKNEGIIYGDPIEGKMLLLRTTDAGQNWQRVAIAPPLDLGEASFAASGTGIRCAGKRDVAICTGGKISRLWMSNDKGEHWKSFNTPIIQGEPSTGIFSFAENNGRWIIVGGDYKNELQRVKHNFYSDDHGRTWLAPVAPTNGYRECIEVVDKDTLLTIGPSGIDVSYNNGLTWEILTTTTGLHVLRRARRGTLLIGAGNKGQIVLIHPEKNH